MLLKVIHLPYWGRTVWAALSIWLHASRKRNWMPTPLSGPVQEISWNPGCTWVLDGAVFLSRAVWTGCRPIISPFPANSLKTRCNRDTIESTQIIAMQDITGDWHG